jgi:hypothetical protein
VLFIKKQEAFAKCSDREWRLLVQGLQQAAADAARAAIPPAVLATLPPVQLPFTVESFHEKIVKVRLGCGWICD